MENLENKFKIKLHYGGNFTSDYRGYENGLVQYVHRCDPDTFSYFELKDVVVSKLKYNNVKSMYYVRPGKTLQQGLHKLYWGNEMCEMVRLALANNNRIEVYVKHGIDTPSLVVNNQEDGSSEEDGSEDDGYSEEDENSEDDSEDSDFSEEASDDSSSEEDDENVPIRSKNKTTPKVSHGKKKSADSEPNLKHTDFVEIPDSDIEIDEYDIENESDEELREIRRKKIDMKKGKAKMPDSSTANASGANAGSSNPPSQPQRGPCSSSQPRQFTATMNYVGSQRSESINMSSTPSQGSQQMDSVCKGSQSSIGKSSKSWQVNLPGQSVFLV